MIQKQISTLILLLLSSIAALILLGLATLILQMLEVQSDLTALRTGALPRLVKISQLSQEAAATISIAPALSANPTRFEFETLLSRIKDKESSQNILIEELTELIKNGDAADTLRDNGELLSRNLESLTEVVRRQIQIRREIDTHIDFLRALAQSSQMVDRGARTDDTAPGEQPAAQPDRIKELIGTTAYRVLNTILDPQSARFPRNRNEIDHEFDRLLRVASVPENNINVDDRNDVPPEQEFIDFWLTNRENVLTLKRESLSNEFQIKALAEENSRIANRLLNSSNREFLNASTDLEKNIDLVDQATRITFFLIIAVIGIFTLGNVLMWLVLKRRVFEPLENVRVALQRFADERIRIGAETRNDEIGRIFNSLRHYMDVINEREDQLAEKTTTLEKLSSQLSKYLSPQVYDSIFSGRQEVKVASSRKKLTVFFSDIVGFTETADRLESEELSQLLNHYLTEMSNIALAYGATIDKYVGDAILLFFGDPETRGDREDALACVRMAVAMRERLHALEQIWRDSGIERPLRVRMGIHTGFCTVGNFGSEDRMDYTIVGGPVNIASRLQAVAQPGEILLSYETFALVKSRIACQARGEIEVKGIAYPVAVYRVMDRSNGTNTERRLEETRPNFTVLLDADNMTESDRREARDLLNRAIEILAKSDSGAGESGSKPPPD